MALILEILCPKRLIVHRIIYKFVFRTMEINIVFERYNFCTVCGNMAFIFRSVHLRWSQKMGRALHWVNRSLSDVSGLKPFDLNFQCSQSLSRTAVDKGHSHQNCIHNIWMLFYYSGPLYYHLAYDLCRFLNWVVHAIFSHYLEIYRSSIVWPTLIT